MSRLVVVTLLEDGGEEHVHLPVGIWARVAAIRLCAALMVA